MFRVVRRNHNGPGRRFKTARFGHKREVARGDFVEVLVDAGSGAAREYTIEATKAGRTVEVRSSRTTVEVRELTRTGGVVRTARFIAPRVLAVVEHPSRDNGREPKKPATRARAA
jgi:hypothetical protein